MQQLLFKTKSGGSPQDKPRVYFTCHPDDFDRTFPKVCEDIFKTYDCVIYYTANMTELLPEDTREFDLERMNMFVVPVTFRLMTTLNRANDYDLKFAKDRNIAILPIMFETGIDFIYSRPENFGNRQYLAPFEHDMTAISYEKKLKKYLESTLFDDKTVERVRKAFDAYIFLSYRKIDRVYANDLMKLIHSEEKFRDIAIWFDEFLTPGREFDREIDEALSLSKLFALAITPNLTKYTLDGKRNYIMTDEYPKAKNTVLDLETGEKLPILPIQVTDMGDGDKKALDDEFPGIPESVDGRKICELSNAMYENLKRIALNENKTDPEHNYLIGLAYLKGIDVETNPERGLELITSAAEDDYPEAMIRLIVMYQNGDNVSRDFHENLKWCQRLYSLYYKELGEEHPCTLWSYNLLANAYSDLGDYQRALEIHKKTYSIRCKVNGEKDKGTLESLNNLALTYFNIGDYRQSLDLNKKAYFLYCECLGKEHPSTLISLGNLCGSYLKVKDFQNALEFSKQLYLTHCKVLGEEHPDTLTSQGNLASVYLELGDYRQALEINKKVYSSRVKVLGENHPDTIASLNNLSFIYGKTGNQKRCLSLSIKAFTSFSSVLGDDNPSTLSALQNLATAYEKVGDYDKQERLSNELYIKSCRVFGEGHLRTITALSAWAMACGNKGNHKQKKELHEQAYKLYCHSLGKNDPLTLNALSNLAVSYGDLGDYDQANTIAKNVYNLRCIVLGKEHPDTVASLLYLAQIHCLNGDMKESLQLYNEANISSPKDILEIFKKIK